MLSKDRNHFKRTLKPKTRFKLFFEVYAKSIRKEKRSQANASENQNKPTHRQIQVRMTDQKPSQVNSSS